MQGTGYVLKGGCALVFAYGIRRHTTDIDFDAAKPTDITRRIRNGLRAAGMEVTFQELVPARRSLRVRVRYRFPVSGKLTELKVDTRFLPKPVASDIAVVNGIRTYRPEALYRQKLAALGSRRAPRDLHDLASIIAIYGDALTDSQVRRSERIADRIDKLAKQFGPRFEKDPILSRFANAEDTLLEFAQAARRQMRKRRLWIQHQRIPVSSRMGDLICEIRDELCRERPDAGFLVPEGPNRPGRSRPIEWDREVGPFR